MIELIKAWQIGFTYYLDEGKARAVAEDMALKYSRNRPDAFTPKMVPMIKMNDGQRVLYFHLTALDKLDKVIE